MNNTGLKPFFPLRLFFSRTTQIRKESTLGRRSSSPADPATILAFRRPILGLHHRRRAATAATVAGILPPAGQLPSGHPLLVSATALHFSWLPAYPSHAPANNLQPPGVLGFFLLVAAFQDLPTGGCLDSSYTPATISLVSGKHSIPLFCFDD